MIQFSIIRNTVTPTPVTSRGVVVHIAEMGQPHLCALALTFGVLL